MNPTTCSSMISLKILAIHKDLKGQLVSSALFIDEKIYFGAKELCSRADPYANKSLPLEFVVGVSGEKSTQVYIDCKV